jgi:hypothetical protein
VGIIRELRTASVLCSEHAAEFARQVKRNTHER